MPHDLTPRLVRGVFFAPKKPSHPCEDQNVGAGLLAKAVCQSKNCWLMHRFREQARSHNKNAASLMFFAQNLDPERYSPRKIQLKVVR
ncbi:hypothetical protein [Pseudomonas proteolytica]|uniref:hypothetical protein n=1 Tax=Pseudomonas proteolytica TaxID=219574 RepID=UPI001474FFCC|nr:hypothetical protein [Pseudomonas proteolytica]NMZ37208.1 hypothetical protein [Pseudomonas proteolytica]